MHIIALSLTENISHLFDLHPAIYEFSILMRTKIWNQVNKQFVAFEQMNNFTEDTSLLTYRKMR